MSALIVDSILTPMKLEAAEYDRLARQIMVAPAEAVADLLKGMATESSAASRVNVALLRNIFEAGKQRSLAVYEPPGHIAGVTINYVRAGDYPRSMALAKLDGFLEEAAMRDEKYAWSDFVDNRFVVHRVEAQHNAILKARTAKAIVAIIENALGIERDAPASA
jgi:thioesterase domain-containing protein